MAPRSCQLRLDRGSSLFALVLSGGSLAPVSLWPLMLESPRISERRRGEWHSGTCLDLTCFRAPRTIEASPNVERRTSCLHCPCICYWVSTLSTQYGITHVPLPQTTERS